MAEDQGSGAWRRKDGRDWRIGSEPETRWIQEDTANGVRITCAIPAVFEAYATLEMAGTGNHEFELPISQEHARHDSAVVAILSEHTLPQSWWLGYLETGSSDIIFPDAPKVELYAPHWYYVLVEAGPSQAATWRQGDLWGENLPDLMFPADRSWLASTLWDDDWTCIGGSRELVDAFLADPDLNGRVREVDPSMTDVTPPGHIAF